MKEKKSLKASRIVFWWIVAVTLGWLAEEVVFQLLPEVDRLVSLALGLSIVATGQSYVLRPWMPTGGVWAFASTIGGVVGFMFGFQLAASDPLRANVYLSTLIWWGSIGAGVGVAQAWSIGRLRISRLAWILINILGFALGGGLALLSLTVLPSGYWQPLIFGLASGGVVAFTLACLMARAGYEV